MEKLRPYFAWKGRTSRADYWKTVFLLVVVAVLIWGVAMLLRTLTTLAGLVLFLLLVPWVMSACLYVRRLHDRDKSAWWLLLFWALPAVLSVAGGEIVEQGQEGGAFLNVAAFGLQIWAFVEFGFLRGTKGPNRYGADPLNPLGQDPAEVFA